MIFYIFDYDSSIIEFYKNFFKNEFPKVQIQYFNDHNELLNAIQLQKPELVLTEFEVSEPFALFKKFQSLQVPFIVISQVSLERAIVESLKSGAYDYVIKSNLKYDYFKLIISRVLLDSLRWQEWIQKYNDTPTFPEFQKYDQLIKNITLQLTNLHERAFHKFPEFIEGTTYILNFLTVKMNIGNLNIIFSEEESVKLHTEWLSNLIFVSQKYGGQLWIKKSDAFTVVFPKDNYLDPILAFIEMCAEVVQLISNYEIDIISLIAAFDQGSVIYRKEKENLYSESINLTYHMVEQLIKPNFHFYITHKIYNNLEKRAKSYFFKYNHSFEGNELYRFEYIC